MKVINEDIKNRTFKNIYLLYGDEPYLKRQYQNRLREAVLGDDDMNYSYFDKDNMSVKDIISVGDTMPFFSDYRMIVISESGFFKNTNEELVEYIKNIPEYLIIVFVEEEIHKNTKLYKAVNEKGYITEMGYQSDKVLVKWIDGLVRKEDKVISTEAAIKLVDMSASSMNLIKSEVEKLISYVGDRTQIELSDVDSCCTTQIVGKIFDMIEAMANKKQRVALELYYDLITMKEPPMRILYFMAKQFNGLLMAHDAKAGGLSSSAFASRIGVAPFVAGKYMNQCKYFTRERLCEAIKDCVEAETEYKRGTINENLMVEMILVKYSGE